MTTHNVTLADETIARLKAHAEPLVDTFDSVVNRAVDALEMLNGGGAALAGNPMRTINPAAPPNLSYTTVHSIVLNGKRFPLGETYWNHLLLAAVREAKKTLSKEQVKELVICNNVLGKKEDNGYKYLEDVGISVQGQDANGAWKAIYHILHAIKVPVEVEFSWQDNPKAAAPGQKGHLSLP
jgi:hypothetical protein